MGKKIPYHISPVGQAKHLDGFTDGRSPAQARDDALRMLRFATKLVGCVRRYRLAETSGALSRR
jgi:hypothetical protein